MDFTSFFRTSALTNGGLGSIFLFTISNNTIVFPPLTIIFMPCHGQHCAAGQKLAGKTIETSKPTFPRTNCCFCVSFSCQKAAIYLLIARKQKTSMIQNEGRMKKVEKCVRISQKDSFIVFLFTFTFCCCLVFPKST